MSSTIGQRLRQAREARSLDLEQVSQTTLIRTHYLKALEADDLDTIPSSAQARGFLRVYADYLGVDLAAASETPGTPASENTIPDLEAESTSPPAYEKETGAGKDDGVASEIFIEIGKSLRTQREILGLSLDDVERHTYLRQHYLEALEDGDMQGLPSPVQGRGMLNNYAAFLGLDPNPLLLKFADGLQAQLAQRQAEQPQTRKKTTGTGPRIPPSLKRFLSADILIGLTLAGFLLMFVVWSAIRIFSVQSEQIPTSTAPSIAEVLLASPTPTLTLTPMPPTPTIPQPQGLFPTQVIATDSLTGAPFPQNQEGNVQVYVTVRYRTWVRILVDDEIALDGRVLPGSAYAYNAENRIEIITGNGAALHIILGQEDLGAMGGFGQIVHQIYTSQGVVSPTPTVTLTPTETPPPTAAPPASATPAPGQATAPPLP